MTNKKLDKNQRKKLLDNYNRKISYLRVSLTESCNLRCNYCYESLPRMKGRDHYLSNSQLTFIIRAFAKLGVEKIRFTGGEPLLRKNIFDLVKGSSDIDSISQIGVTTNGLLLNRLFDDLVSAGLNRINISLDTLERDKFQKITGVDAFNKVLGSIYRAIESKKFPIVKINTVVMRGINDDEIQDFADWALARNVDLRFIEFMPTCRSGWGRERVVPESEILELLNMTLEEVPGFDKNRGPAQSYYSPGKPGRISFISPVSCNFCGDCNRLRLTSTGDMIGCLFGNTKVNLKKLIDDGCDQEELINFIKTAVTSPNFRRLSSGQSISDSEPFMRGIGG